MASGGHRGPWHKLTGERKFDGTLAQHYSTSSGSAAYWTCRGPLTHANSTGHTSAVVGSASNIVSMLISYTPSLRGNPRRVQHEQTTVNCVLLGHQITVSPFIVFRYIILCALDSRHQTGVHCTRASTLKFVEPFKSTLL